jgi:DNA-binding protein Fis
MTLMERHLILRVLQRTGGNQAQAAKLLGIDRGTLRDRIRSSDISIEQSVS